MCAALIQAYIISNRCCNEDCEEKSKVSLFDKAGSFHTKATQTPFACSEEHPVVEKKRVINMNGIKLLLLLFMILIAATMGMRGGHGIGGKKDEGGCYISAGYHWCAKKQKCIRPWEETCDEKNNQGK